jgi:beta-phosphoglucomutase-like phosphatase (HAD superfamily)
MEYAIGRKPTEEEAQKCSIEKELIYLEMCKADPLNTKLAAGVEEFLDYICDKQIPHTIATMSEKINVDFYLEAFNLQKWFDKEKIVYSNGKIPGKPAPDIYLIAAKNIGIEPKDCVVFEDALSGINAAKAANIGKIIAVASKEPIDFYKKIDCVSEVITDFSVCKNLIK